MSARKLKLAIIVSVGVMFAYLPLFANAPVNQTAGGVSKSESDIEKGRKLEKRVETPAVKAEVEDQVLSMPEAGSGEKVLIKKIKIEGVTLIKSSEIDKLVKKYENRQLSMGQMQKIADLISGIYRSKGYPTSRAYIPVQSIRAEGVLIIRVVEGTVGEVTVRGNKFFKSSIYKKKLNLKPGESFNYTDFQRALTLINEKPDRFVKATLLPGKVQGSTDIVLDAKDRLPIHAGYTYDNYGSRYIGRLRQSFDFTDNNLFGFDDQLYFKETRARDSLLMTESGRYLLPINNGLDLGLVASYARTKLGREFTPIDSIGKATILGAYLNQVLVSDSALDLRFNLGFDYKEIRNFLIGTEVSRDDDRLVKAGLDLDYTDNWGRTLLTGEIDQGIPNIMGGLRAKDSRATRVGAGGEFTKGVFNLYRSQPMPFSSSLLLKNNAQISNNTLLSSEEFQVGGPYSVRGYASGEYAGDSGIYSAAEWAFPYYFIPKKFNIPFFKANLYDAARFVLFYDWSETYINHPLSTENKERALNSAGFGFRFNFKYVTAKAEFAYPIHGPESSDTGHEHMQPWIEFTANF